MFLSLFLQDPSLFTLHLNEGLYMGAGFAGYLDGWMDRKIDYSYSGSLRWCLDGSNTLEGVTKEIKEDSASSIPYRLFKFFTVALVMLYIFSFFPQEWHLLRNKSFCLYNADVHCQSLGWSQKHNSVYSSKECKDVAPPRVLGLMSNTQG